MKGKIKITESKLKQLIKEAVVNELSADLLQRAADACFKNNSTFRPDYATIAKDKNGNPLDKRGRKWVTRGQNFEREAHKRRREEVNSTELAKEAMEVFDSAIGDIEWDENEFAGDETYGPTTGYVETEDGWKFEVPGQCDGPYDTHIEEDALIDFETPDGQKGKFYW